MQSRFFEFGHFRASIFPFLIAFLLTFVFFKGCGSQGGDAHALYARTILSYLAHPFVRAAVLLEHGCEMTHNQYMLNRLSEMSARSRHTQIRGDNLPSRFFTASVQNDGGIQACLDKSRVFFERELDSAPSVAVRSSAPLGAIKLGLVAPAASVVPEEVGRALALLVRNIVEAGGVVVCPEKSPILTSRAFCRELVTNEVFQPRPNLLYGESCFFSSLACVAGFHVMQCPTSHWVETVTGLAATGVELMLGVLPHKAMGLQSSPVVPLLQLTWTPFEKSSLSPPAPVRADVDVVLALSDPMDTVSVEMAVERAGRMKDIILHSVLSVASREKLPALWAQGNTDFQVTRGIFGVSV
jgi:hypothetical protein